MHMYNMTVCSEEDWAPDMGSWTICLVIKYIHRTNSVTENMCSTRYHFNLKMNLG